MDKVLEVDAATNTCIERTFTREELDQREADEVQAQAAERARLKAQAQREAALDKLAALGLTHDDLTALGL